MEIREIIPLKQRPNWVIKLPGSKSITNRALLCASLAKGESRLFGTLKSDDSDVMVTALRKLGVRIKEHKDFIEVSGTGGKFKSGKITLDLRGSGTATRFLTATMMLRNGETVITGNKRMQERPIADLIDGLRQLGVSIEYLGKRGCPPLLIKDLRLKINEKPKIGNHKFATRARRAEIVIRMKGDKSSQFFSALLMIAPILPNPIKIEVIGDLVSKPYIDVTLSVMEQFGVKVRNDSYQTFYIKPQRYKPTDFIVEGDATAASYWTSIAYLHHGKVKFENLNKKCVQGDVKYAEVLSKIGKSEIDMKSMPDSAMTLAITASFIKGQTKITGLSTLRIKETDRLEALGKELKKVGVIVNATKDSITISPTIRSTTRPTIRTYNDHRMAMCFAVVGTMIPGVTIENPECVKKTYPDFWKDLELAYLSPIKLGQKNLVLTGMRCSGKTYLGKKIARILKRKFVDLDIEIERCEKMKIEDIVKRYGWPYFRKVEQKICSKFSSRKNLVIAMGGGVILDEKNIKNLKKNSVNIFIFSSPSVIVERIKKYYKNRPTLTGKGIVREVKDIWKKRRDLYIKYADVVWDNTSGKIVENNLIKVFL